MPSLYALNLLESMGSIRWMVPSVLVGIQWSGNEVLHWLGLQKFKASDNDMCVCVQFTNLIYSHLIKKTGNTIS